MLPHQLQLLVVHLLRGHSLHRLRDRHRRGNLADHLLLLGSSSVLHLMDNLLRHMDSRHRGLHREVLEVMVDRLLGSMVNHHSSLADSYNLISLSLPL